MVVCFGLPAPLLFVGAQMVPLQVQEILDEPLFWEGPAHLIEQVACGICGLGTLAFVMAKLLSGSRAQFKYPGVIWAGVLLGAIPLFEIFVHGTLVWKVFAAIPLVAAIHVIALSREHLFPSARRGLTHLGMAVSFVLSLVLLFNL